MTALLEIPDELELFSIMALGYPDEQPTATEVDALDKPSAKRDESGRLTVQKLKLDAICHLGRYGQKLS